MIEIYGVIAIMLVMVLSYFAGMKTANWYRDKAETEKRHALELQYMRLRAGTDFNDPTGPYLASPSGGRTTIRGFTPAQMNAFEARLKDKGSATIQLNQAKTTKNEK